MDTDTHAGTGTATVTATATATATTTGSTAPPAAPAGPGPGLAAVAEKLRGLAGGHAAEADRRGEPADDAVELIRSHGFARHFVPARLGGTEGTFTELTRAVVTVGEGCAATAWLASLTAHSARFAAHLPEEGQRALWGYGPDVTVAAGLVPSGRAVPDGDGWRLNGSWGYVSGVHHADWILVCAAVPAPGGPPELRFFATPRGTYTVRDTWDSVGMRATGSHTVVLEDVPVPGHLSFARTDMLAGRNRHSPAPVHNVPLPAAGGLAFVAPVAGAAGGALAAYAAGLTGRRRTPSAETRLLRASGRIEAARLLIERNAAACDEHRFTPESLAHGERNATFAAELLTGAVDLLVHGAGTGSFAETAALQRFWRDVTSAASHVALQYDTSARRSFAAAVLGPEQPPEPRP